MKHGYEIMCLLSTWTQIQITILMQSPIKDTSFEIITLTWLTLTYWISKICRKFDQCTFYLEILFMIILNPINKWTFLIEEDQCSFVSLVKDGAKIWCGIDICLDTDPSCM